ncbi:MAG TPA: AAA family ATPase [Candidatus Limnocylindria bacterium]|nr:AAA family ATPase [Candidatus Limnocylindria bacterium]
MSAAGAPTLAGTEDHPHARMVLGSALASGSPSHAYLFHGPPGTGKRTAARALAAELLAGGEDDEDAARTRVLHGTHPDLTWVRPTGAHVMRVSDVEEPVVAAAGRTPFESRRRVFVLERVDTMNDEVANRLLKTLEEPPSFVHLILLTDQLGRVLETVVSRCQLVRFDPLPAERIASMLQAEGVEPGRAGACGRLALGNASRARFLASEEGEALRDDVERLVLDALGADRSLEPWAGLLERAEAARAAAQADVNERRRQRLEYEPPGRERNALEREFEEMARRDGRRARTEVLALGLELAAIAFRDLLCMASSADGAVLGRDRIAALAPAAEGRDPVRLREAAGRCEDVRSALELNVMEELALSALTFRLRELVGG